MSEPLNKFYSAFAEIDFPVTASIKLAIAIAFGLLVHWLLRAAVQRMARREFTLRLLARTKWLGRLAFAMLGAWLIAPALRSAPALSAWVSSAMGAGIIVLIGWTLLIALNTYFDLTSRDLRIDEEDNLVARKRLTQIRLLRRIASVTLVLLTAATAVMTIPSVRELGLSLFASAGVAGIILGLAARPVLSNLIAGVQIALTQPIRLDDAVVVEGEWGWIEDIRGTYVVIRIWDLRRLIVPLSYFIEHPFQNWTRESASLIGSVVFYVDYTVPVAAVRAQLEILLKDSPKWDGKVANLQVTDIKQDTVELRALMSATNSPRCWDLRCEVRERMLDWLQKTYPDALPKRRAVIAGGGQSDAAMAGAPAADMTRWARKGVVADQG